MDTAQRKNPLLQLVLRCWSHPSLWFLIPLLIFVPMSLSNFISHSEFWGITSGQLFGSFSPEAIVVYYRPIFYALLKSLYFLPLDNISHIKAARLLFGVIASFNCFLIAAIVYQRSKDKKLSFIYILFLLSIHTYFYNIFRVRSDILALFFFLLAVYKTNLDVLKGLPTFSWKTLGLIFLCFLSTPKAIFLIFVFAAYTFYLNSTEKASSPKFRIAFYLMLPFAFVTVVSSLFLLLQASESNPFVYALLYFSNTTGQLFQIEGWSNLILSFKINFLHYIFLSMGWILFLKNKKQDHWSSFAILAGASSLSFLIYPEKWDYFFASYIPLIFLPSLYVFSWILKKRARFALVIPLFVTPFYMTHFTGWHFSNKEQIRVIGNLGDLVDNSPEALYFDSTGLLPRHPILMVFYGPGDERAHHNNLDILKEVQPTFIFFTAKVSLGEPEILKFLHLNYKEITEDVWIHSQRTPEIPAKITETKPTSLNHLFIYDRRPYIRNSFP